MTDVLTGQPFLEGQVAVVTGAAWGIGRVVARHLLQVGARVTLADVDATGLEKARAELDPAGQRTRAVPTDVRSEPDVVRMFEAAVAAFGRLDVLVNVAGVYPTNEVLDMSTAEWQRVIDTNLTGSFLCDREAARIMVRQGHGGRIVNITSQSSQRATTGKAHYCASKAGQVLLTKTLALELGAHGILVNGVSPGLVETEAKLARVCPPEDVAKAVLFLLTPDAAYITGQIIAVDGGSSAGQILRV
jgi:3-oxoacyl-[acyl-carrier protein] reductase